MTGFELANEESSLIWGVFIFWLALLCLRVLVVIKPLVPPLRRVFLGSGETNRGTNNLLTTLARGIGALQCAHTHLIDWVEHLVA